MISDMRHWYNANFTQEKYQAMLSEISGTYGHTPNFRIAESPIFIPEILQNRLKEACQEINEVICKPNFKAMTDGAIQHPSFNMPSEDDHTRFLQMDFGISLDANGDPFPHLIEIQGFPSVYFFQNQLSLAYRKHFDIPEEYGVYMNGHTSESYIEMLRRIIVGDCDPKNVVLLEIEPEKQNTRIDFLGTCHHLGIKELCLSKLKKSGRRLYYLDEDNKDITVHRIYNRVIFDELDLRNDLPREFYFRDDVDVEWVGHPSWFFRISKFTMPLLSGQYVPDCHYLHHLDRYPDDLENYVLKPLFSFSGAGVLLDISSKVLDGIKDRSNYLLQRKISYAPIIQSPNEPVKCEIRMLMLWEDGEKSAKIVNNLTRLSKGAMIGVKFNKDKDWVGGSVGFFKK